MSSVKIYTLEVPSTRPKVAELVTQILSDCPTASTRVSLKFGTCFLMCRDEGERRVHGRKVTAIEAVECLINSVWSE